MATVTNREYLLPSEVDLYYDVRRVVGLASDTGVPIDESDLGATGSTGYNLIYKLIRAQSARIDSRCQQGKRYSHVDLETIAYTARTAAAGDADDIGSDPEKKFEAKWKRFAILQQLTADLFFGDLLARRGYGAEQFKLMAPRYVEALEILEQLYQGEAIFDLSGPKTAGVPQVATLGQNVLKSTDFNRMFGIWPNSTYSNPYGILGTWRY